MDGRNDSNRAEDKESIEVSGFSVRHMDTSVNPMVDFYEYSVGNWLKTHPVPSDKSRWGTFEEISEQNSEKLRDILQRCATDPEERKDPVKRSLGDFYSSAMDTELLEKLKFSPVAEYLDAVDSISTRDDIMKVVILLHSRGISPFFHAMSQTDEKNSSIYALYLFQGGISLPDRDYYLSEDFSAIREKYLGHVARIFSIYGKEEAESAEIARNVMSMETGMAKAGRSQVDLRDAEKNYNRLTIEELGSEYPSIRLPGYLESMGVPKVDYVIVGQPEFFKALDGILEGREMSEIRDYLRWTVMHSAAPFLFPEVEDEHFDMFNRTIRGQQDPEPRWKKSVAVIDMCMGEALGKLYVEEHFGPEAKERMTVMVDDIRAVFRSRLENLGWMSQKTRDKALSKFDRFTSKIGYPEKFRDYSSIEIRKDDYFGNISRSDEFEARREAVRVGMPVDKNEWWMTPPTVNAYFSPPDNEIVFPAGILQPPIFDMEADDAVNYGAIGSVISHEITHGYDDQGRHYDEEGNLSNWWTEEDKKAFEDLAGRVVDLYGRMEILPGVKVNGELTLGENIADFGGVSIAYEALQRRLSREPERRQEVDGLTPEQRFFISYAQIWRQNILEPAARMLATIDPHSPNRFRATLPVYSHSMFEKAFSGFGTPDSTKKEKIEIW